MNLDFTGDEKKLIVLAMGLGCSDVRKIYIY